MRTAELSGGVPDQSQKGTPVVTNQTVVLLMISKEEVCKKITMK